MAEQSGDRPRQDRATKYPKRLPIAMLSIAVVTIAGSMGCSTSGQEQIALALVLVDGGQVSELLSTSEFGTVALVPPHQCLSCDRDLRRILLMQRDSHPRIPLILSRTPSEFERKRMVLEGLPAGAPVLQSGSQVALENPMVLTTIGEDSPRLITLKQAVPLLRKAFRAAADTAQPLQEPIP